MTERVVKFSCLESVVLATDSLRNELERNESGRQRSAQYGYDIVGGVYEHMIPQQFSALCELSAALKEMDGINYDAVRLRNGDLWIKLTDGCAKLPWIRVYAWIGMVREAEQLGICAEGTYEQARLALLPS